MRHRTALHILGLFHLAATACHSVDATEASDAAVTVDGKDASVPAMSGDASASTDAAVAVGGGSGSFTFLVYGDSRSGNGCDGNQVHKQLIQRMAAEPAQLAIHVGDLVTGYDQSTNWLDDGACTGADAPGSLKTLIAPLQNKPAAPGLAMFFFPVVGNHEANWGDGWYPDGFGKGFCDVFDPKKLIPNHTQQSYFRATGGFARYDDAQFFQLACSKTNQAVYPSYFYYSFDFQNTHFIALSLFDEYVPLEICNSCGADKTDYGDYYKIHQLDWLRADLAATKSKPGITNIFAFMHSPVFTTGEHAPSPSFGSLSQLFTDNGVKVAFAGHNHVYERSHPIANPTGASVGVRDDAHGTVYTVTGGGGSALHSFRDPDPLTALRSAEYHYLKVDVAGTAVNVTAIRPDGTVLDSYQR